MSGSSKYSQFSYKITPEEGSKSRLDFTGLQLIDQGTTPTTKKLSNIILPTGHHGLKGYSIVTILDLVQDLTRTHENNTRQLERFSSNRFNLLQVFGSIDVRKRQ